MRGQISACLPHQQLLLAQPGARGFQATLDLLGHFRRQPPAHPGLELTEPRCSRVGAVAAPF